VDGIGHPVFRQTNMVLIATRISNWQAHLTDYDHSRRWKVEEHRPPDLVKYCICLQAYTPSAMGKSTNPKWVEVPNCKKNMFMGTVKVYALSNILK